MKKIKVLMGIIGKGNGGLSMYMVNLFKKLDHEKFDCTFMSIAEKPYFEKDIKELGGRILFITPRSQNPKKHRDDIRNIMKEDFDVCHIHLSTASNICPILEAKRAKIPVVIAHSHSSKVEGSLYPKVLHIINREKLKKLDILRFACSKAAGNFAFKNAEFTVMNNGIDTARFDYNEASREKIRKELNVGDDFVVGQVGRLVPVKNHRFTVELFEKLQKNCPESRLLIVGDGPLEEQIKTKTKELVISDKVIFTGNVRNPEEYFQAMDCLMIPSLFEGFPLTVVEGICSGLCCFVSDKVPGEVKISDLVEFIPLDGDMNMIADTVLKAKDIPRVSQAETLKDIGFDADKCVKDIENIYLYSVTGGN